MQFKFEITSVHRLPNAQLAVLTGNLISGKILANSKAQIQDSTGIRSPLLIKGVLTEYSETSPRLSITAPLWQPSVKSAGPGDTVTEMKEIDTGAV